MFGLQAMVDTLKSARKATLACMQQLGDDPRNAMADAMFAAYIAEFESLILHAQSTPRATVPFTKEFADEDFAELLGADFDRRVADLDDVGAPLVDLLAQMADVYKKRANRQREQQTKQDNGQIVSLNRNLALVNYRAQVMAAEALRRFACGVQQLFFPIGQTLVATRLHQMTCPEVPAV